MARPFFPPACASVIWAVVVALLLTIRSNSLPTLLAGVIPLFIGAFPFDPLAFVESGYVSILPNCQVAVVDATGEPIGEHPPNSAVTLNS